MEEALVTAYRAVWTTGRPDAEGQGGPGDTFDLVRRAIRAWLRRKDALDSPLSSGLHDLGDGKTLEIDSAFGDNGEERTLHIQFDEDGVTGRWRTTLVTCQPEPDANPLLSVELEYGPSADGQIARPPRLIRDLLRLAPGRDGLAALTDEPQLVQTVDVDHLLDVLVDSGRRLPLILGARPPGSDPEWEHRWRKIAHESAGMASLYLLADPAATDLFRKRVYDHHRVAPGAIRTYLPEVDPAWPADGLRHRVLSYARLSDRADTAWRHIPDAVRRSALQTPIPAPLRDIRVRPVTAEALDDARRAGQHAKDTAADAATDDTALREEIEVLTGLLEQADAENRALRDARARLTKELDTTAQDRAKAVDEREFAYIEQTETLGELHRAQAEIRRLRRALQQDGRGELAYAAADAARSPNPPESFEELLERLPELPSLLFTGDRRSALDLDATGRAPIWAAKAWDALQALDSYARCSFSGDFSQYCRNTPPGEHGFSPGQVVMVESESVHNQWADERMFPVPETVDPSGIHMMEAHIKLEARGGIAPRIHFLDKTSSPLQKVIVGMIGRHLTNTRT